MHSNNPKISTLKYPTAGIKKPPSKPSPIVGKFQGHAVRLGLSYDTNKWRCSTCKFLNQSSQKQCKMCREEHKVKQISRQPLRQQPYNANKTRVPLNGAVRGSSGIASNGSLANKGGKGAVRGGGGVRVGGSPLLQNDKMIGDKGAASDVRPRAFSKPAAVPQRTNCARNGSVGAGRLGSEANIVTFKDYEQQHKSIMGEAKKPRFHKESNLQMLKKIAQNSQNGDTMPCMRKVKDKQFVQNLRDPAKFNMHTFVREYGDVPK